MKMMMAHKIKLQLYREIHTQKISLIERGIRGRIGGCDREQQIQLGFLLLQERLFGLLLLSQSQFFQNVKTLFLNSELLECTLGEFIFELEFIILRNVKNSEEHTTLLQQDYEERNLKKFCRNIPYIMMLMDRVDGMVGRFDGHTKFLHLTLNATFHCPIKSKKTKLQLSLISYFQSTDFHHNHSKSPFPHNATSHYEFISFAIQR